MLFNRNLKTKRRHSLKTKHLYSIRRIKKILQRKIKLRNNKTRIIKQLIMLRRITKLIMTWRMKLLKMLIGIMESRSAFVLFNPIYLRLNNVKKCNLPRIVERAMNAWTGIRKKKQGIKIKISLNTLNSTSAAILIYTFSCRINKCGKSKILIFLESCQVTSFIYIYSRG